MNTEVEVIEPIWHNGEQIEPQGEKPTIIALPRSEAVYLQGIGRVRIIEPAKNSAKAPRKEKKTNAAG